MDTAKGIWRMNSGNSTLKTAFSWAMLLHVHGFSPNLGIHATTPRDSEGLPGRIKIDTL
jgi:hypothetical protein